MKVNFKIDSKGCWLIRFRPVGELPKGLVKKETAKGFIDIAGVYDNNQVSPIDYDELLKQINMQGQYSDFKDLLGFWMDDRELLDEKWYRISIEFIDS